MKCSMCSKEITQDIIDKQIIKLRYTYTMQEPTLCFKCYAKHLKILISTIDIDEEGLKIINEEIKKYENEF